MVTSPVVADLNTVTPGHGQQVINPPVTRVIPHSVKRLVCCCHALIVSYVTSQSNTFDLQKTPPPYPATGENESGRAKAVKIEASGSRISELVNIGKV